MGWHIVREFIQSAAALVPLARLIWLNLTKQFRALAWYLAVLSVSDLLAGGLPQQSIAYFWYYIVLNPVKSAAGIFAVRELITLIFADYPGIRTVGRWALYAGIGFSIAASIALTRFFSYSGSQPRSKWGLYYIEMERRSIHLTLAIAIIAILFALSKYPLNLGRNTYLSCAFCSAMFLIEAAQLLVDSSKRLFFSDTADTVAAIALSACLLSWGLLLREQTARAPRIAVTTADEDRLLQQLESLNSLMTRTARR